MISGEWCHEVLQDFFQSSKSSVMSGSFAGRGVQYHLGFHHWSDTCRYITFTFLIIFVKYNVTITL